MDKPAVEITSEKQVQGLPPASLERLPSILWDSAIGAFVQAILITVLGTIAIEIAGGIWHEMTPSAPPLFSHKPLAEAEPAATASNHWNVGSSFLQHKFGILFFLLFSLKVWSQMTGRSVLADPANGSPTHAQRIAKELSENWFGLVVKNAFVALVSAIVVVWVQQFSAWYWIRHLLLDSALSNLKAFFTQIFGATGANAIDSWFSWYGENQLKLTFWAFYIAAICDDLGIPNLKTLGRWCWARMRKRVDRQTCHG
jgi:hypothetical protein